MTPIIHLHDLGVRLSGRDILRGVSAEINANEFIGVFGPNGAGKSTLMRCLLGLLPRSAGDITVFGKAPGRENDQIGYMPQVRALFENVALSAQSLVAATVNGSGWGLPWATTESRSEVTRVLRLAGAEEYAERPFALLSGGERQRVMLAQALIGNPKLLILDEPLLSLDPKHQARMIETVHHIQHETGATVLFVAHDINPLIGVMDRVLYVAGGSAAIGPVDQVLSAESLSKLYGTNMLVVRAEGRIFIVATEGNVMEAEHEH
ncbi:MAG: metal ABC transporter ATP-binding protein [Acidobacteriaceae bacterium]